MAKSKAAKQEAAAVELERFSRASATVIAEYRGLSANDLAALRAAVREAGGEFAVVKNRVVAKGIREKQPDAAAVIELLRGPVGVGYLYGDVAAGSKALSKFADEHKVFKVTGGMIEGGLVTAAQLDEISNLPSKEVLLGQIVGLLVAPHRSLLYVLNGVAGNLVRVLGAIKDTKS